MPETVPIDQIIADSRCQSRTGIGLALVQEYADAIREGAALPPLATIRANEGYYVYDGFHRLEAYRQVGKKDVAVESEPGDVWDAIERSCAVNATHGQRRTPADVKNAVKKIIDVMHHRGVRWNQSEIADKCSISQQRVSQIIGSEPSYKNLYDSAAPATTVTRNGTTYEMNTSNIGKKPAWQAPKMPTRPIDPGPDVDDDYPDAEVVDPSDPSAFVWEPPPQPKSSPTPEPEMVALRYRQYRDPEQRAGSIAAAIRAMEGENVARLVVEALNRQM